MKILYKYISIGIAKYFLILIAFFSVVIVSSQLLHLPSIMYHTGIFKFFQTLFFVNLSFFKFQLFFGFFIASLFVGYGLRENREIYAIYSAGISKNQILIPVFVISIFFLIFALIVSMLIVPFANRERAQFITINVKKHILDSLVEKNFMKLSENITIYVQKKENNEMRNIFIFNRKEGLTITAQKAIFINNILTLKNGFIQIPGNNGFNLMKFDTYRFTLDIKYMKKYQFEDLDNETLINIIKTNSKEKFKAIGVLTDRILFSIPFLFIGVLGFMMGIEMSKNRDSLIGLVVLISIIYLVLNTYSIKLIQKSSINPLFYLLFLIVYFGGITYYFYKKK